MSNGLPPDQPIRDPTGSSGPSPGLVGEALRTWIRARTGISIGDQNQAPVELAVRMEAERHALDPVVYVHRLMHGALPPQAFIDAIATNESYFFRALEQMRVVVNRLIPERLAARPGQPVRILSLPCARGEEPYSLAVLCEEHRIPPTAVQIVGADISATCIADASRGRYGPLALRRTEPELARRWFTPVGARAWQLEPALLPRVELHRLNLLDDAEAVLGRRFDILFCENLLIYFDPETTAAALSVLTRLLQPDGWLFVDHTEWNIPRAHFQMHELGGCVGFRLPRAPEARISAERRPVIARAPSGPGSAARIDTRRPSAQPLGQSRARASAPPRPSGPRRTTPATAARALVEERLERALEQYRAKQFAEALADFEGVLAAAPDHPGARLGKARVLADCGEDFEALESLESLLHGPLAAGLTHEHRLEALVLMGLLLHKKGLKDLARGYLLEVRRLDPRHPSLGLLNGGRPGDADG